jgi:hypothetical protein
MTMFRARRKGGVYVELAPYAAGLLANLARQLIELLSDGEPIVPTGDDPLEEMLAMNGPRETPEDPALRRLLPDAHRDDAEVSAEFRRFTEGTLRAGKVQDASVVLASLGTIEEATVDDIEFELDREEARAWLRCLTDLRLTLAERLGVTAGDEEYWESLDEDDERSPVHEIYSWLGYLLESLLDVVRR